MHLGTVLLHIVRLILLPLAWLSERLGNRFYVGLGGVIGVVGVYAIFAGHTAGMQHQAYDLIMRSRFNPPAVDPGIVIVDIDEASLAAMAPEYGRWPWPRSVMAELVEALRRQGPAAIVFDITFADRDVFHPDSDAHLRETVTGSANTFFPMIRLNPANDEQSELRLARIPGVHPASKHPEKDATVAMVMPYFWPVLDDRRLGMNNLFPDDDGVVRSYPVYREIHGWRVGSLPANVAAQLGASLPARSDILLNWRGAPTAYTVVPFYDLYADLLREQRRRPPDEFADKIVIVGSTAPSLFDLKPTPVARLHPGVEILATAIDNFANSDYLTDLPRWLYALVTLSVVSLLTLAFVYNIDYRLLNPLFTVVQLAFLVLTFTFLNYTTVFVDLTAPFTAGLVYFFIARIYSLGLTLRRNGHPLLSTLLDSGSECHALLMGCRLRGHDRRERMRVRALLQREAGLTRYGVAAARLFKPAPLVHAMYKDTLLLYWLVAPREQCAALDDALDMLGRALPGVDDKLRRRGRVDLYLHAVAFTVDADGQWRERAREALSTVMENRAGMERLNVHPSSSFWELVRTCQYEPRLKALGIAGEGAR